MYTRAYEYWRFNELLHVAMFFFTYDKPQPRSVQWVIVPGKNGFSFLFVQKRWW